MSKPCQGEAEHAPSADAAGELQKNWHFFTTPAAPGTSRNRPTWRAAVSIDCEMGVAESGEPELIRVSVADYFSGATLLDSLVWPDVKMDHYNARFSGVTRRDMLEARRRRACLLGRGGAREAVWKHVGPDTVVVGHGANSDLGSLRLIHHRVVDTLLVEEAVAKLEREADEAAVASGQEKVEDQGVPDTPTAQQHPGGRGWSLKALAHRRLGREIQKKGRGHDSVEDALAARDLLHWHIVNRVMEA